MVLLLSSFGVLMIASALAGNEVLADWPWRQAGFLAIGLILLFLTAIVDYRLLTSITYPAYGLLLIALVLIWLTGTIVGGAQRWLVVGDFFLQPSELMKIGMILALARYLSDREDQTGNLLTPLGAILVIAPAVILIYL